MDLIEFHNHIWLPGDPLGDQLVDDMDRMGIRRMLVHACDLAIWSYTTGNEGTAEAVKKHPDRLLGTVCLDFRAGLAQCRELIRWAAGEGLIGAKMFPNLGYYPDNPEFFPIYEALAEEHFFAAFHLGLLAVSDVNPRLPMSTKYANPFYLEEPAIRYPELDFVICHMGGMPGVEETLALTRFHANIYADLALGYGVEAFRHMGSRVNLVDWEKFMWGTDIPDDGHAWEENLSFWRENAHQLGYEDKLPMLLHENAARFLARYTV
jgi:predicted TIM-barrel fold metal-dependent hydrolase